jgi:hypothetical protein
MLGGGGGGEYGGPATAPVVNRRSKPIVKTGRGCTRRIVAGACWPVEAVIFIICSWFGFECLTFRALIVGPILSRCRGTLAWT